MSSNIQRRRFMLIPSLWKIPFTTISKCKGGAQGAFNRNNAPRRITWDENMFPTLHSEDVITYHAHMSADN
jgi:hypothetical protein